ncbi:MAG: hypothetical protein AB7F43_10700 [Bacteriovoracia bacterium]
MKIRGFFFVAILFTQLSFSAQPYHTSLGILSEEKALSKVRFLLNQPEGEISEFDREFLANLVVSRDVDSLLASAARLAMVTLLFHGVGDNEVVWNMLAPKIEEFKHYNNTTHPLMSVLYKERPNFVSVQLALFKLAKEMFAHGRYTVSEAAWTILSEPNMNSQALYDQIIKEIVNVLEVSQLNPRLNSSYMRQVVKKRRRLFLAKAIQITNLSAVKHALEVARKRRDESKGIRGLGEKNELTEVSEGMKTVGMIIIEQPCSDLVNKEEVITPRLNESDSASGSIDSGV